MVLFILISTALLVIMILFIAFWIPSERANLDGHHDNIDLKNYWKIYLASMILVSVSLAGLHFLEGMKPYISINDIPIYFSGLYLVSLGARRIYLGLKDFILRR